MFKQFYICRNLALFDEIQKLIIEVQNKHGDGSPVTDRFSLEDVVARVNSDYRELLESRNDWKSIREDKVLLTALRDELRRLHGLENFKSRCG